MKFLGHHFWCIIIISALIQKLLPDCIFSFHTLAGNSANNKRGVRREEARTFLFYDMVRDTTRCDLKIPLCGGWMAVTTAAFISLPGLIYRISFFIPPSSSSLRTPGPVGRKRAPQWHGINNYQIRNNNLLRLAGQE